MSYYKALISFAMYGKTIKQSEIISEEEFTEIEIQDLLQAGYIEVYDGSLAITENGIYEVEGYDSVDVNVEGSSVEVDNLVDAINGEVI